MTAEIALTYWRRALLAEEFGLAIPISGGEPSLRKAQRILYDARKASGDEALKKIIMCMPEGGKEIWLVKKDVELENA